MTDRRPSLSLCMIVRNEAEMLPACLESVAGAVDEIIVVDTGSTDETVHIAEAAGARVLRHVWRDDFSEARNVSLAAATGDWILWMDADERLLREEHSALRSCLESGPDAYLVPVVNETATGSHTIQAHRLFRNGPAIRFSGRIHEQVSPSFSAARYTVGQAPFSISHLGYNLGPARLAEKHARNLRILQQAKAQEPRNAYIRFTLAQNHLLRKDHAAAEAELRAALGHTTERMVKPLPADIQASAYTNLAECALHRDDPRQALAHCAASLRTVPVQITAHLTAYQAYRALEQEEAALAELSEVERLTTSGFKGGSAIEVAVDPDDLSRAIGHCCLRLNRPGEARRCFERALSGGTHRARTLTALARCAVAEDRLEEALRFVDEALALDPDEEGLLDLAGFILLKQGNFMLAADCLGKLCLRRPDDQVLRKRLAGTLVKAGRHAEAMAVLSDLNGPAFISAGPKAQARRPDNSCEPTKSEARHMGERR